MATAAAATAARNFGTSLLLALVLGACLQAAPVEIWVAPKGDDLATGTREQPFASIAMAQRRVRELRRTGDPAVAEGARILIHGGVYPLSSPWLVRWEDSGSAASPTTIEGADGESVVVTGGVAIKGWRLAETLPDGLPGAGRGRVAVAEVPRVGGRPLLTRDLWVNGQKAVRARYPNTPAMERLKGWDRTAHVAAVPSTSVAGLRDAAGVEMVLEQQWEIAILRVRTVEREGETARLTFLEPESTLEFQHPWPQPILPPKGGGGFFLTNAVEFLDAPGEWFQDPANGRIYYWPQERESLETLDVVAPTLSSLLRVEGSLDRPVQHVRFRNLTFAHAAWNEPSASGHVPLQAAMPMVEAYSLRPPGTPDKKALENQAWIRRATAGVTVTAASHLAFEHCRFEHTGLSALDLISAVRDVRIEGCVFQDIGGNGIQVGSFQEGGVETHVPYAPADDREVCAGIRIANNLVRDAANADWGAVAIIVGYAREVAIEHNDIADTSYTGISIGWGWTRTANASRDNKVHANRLQRIATRLCDTAGVYTLSAQPGTVVSENVVEEIRMSPYVDRPDHWFYYYTDEGTSHATVRDNWSPTDKFLQNANGPGNVWVNNGPAVSAEIKARAGLEPAFRSLLPVDTH